MSQQWGSQLLPTAATSPQMGGCSVEDGAVPAGSAVTWLPSLHARSISAFRCIPCLGHEYLIPDKQEGPRGPLHVPAAHGGEALPQPGQGAGGFEPGGSGDPGWGRARGASSLWVRSWHPPTTWAPGDLWGDPAEDEFLRSPLRCGRRPVRVRRVGFPRRSWFWLPQCGSSAGGSSVPGRGWAAAGGHLAAWGGEGRGSRCVTLTESWALLVEGREWRGAGDPPHCCAPQTSLTHAETLHAGLQEHRHGFAFPAARERGGTWEECLAAHGPGCPQGPLNP